MDSLAGHLAAHEFRTLFVERLGWDRANGAATATADGVTLSFEVIAHKRGFKIILCKTDRYTVFNRGRLRAIQKQLLTVAHEHIAIYCCEDPWKQVWQWAVHLPDGRRVRHREHPFFSATPPEGLVVRLNQLRFTLAEEENLTLVDALNRVRLALDTQSELDLFVRKPGYAERGDRLARAMRDGGEKAFHAFVLFHRPLARWGSKRLQRWFGMDAEDAEQIGMIAVLRAAVRFRPELGYQFSTYATRAIHQQCHRDGPADSLIIGMPAAVYWPHVRLRKRAECLDTRSGAGASDRLLRWMARRDRGFDLHWTRLHRALDVRSLSDSREPEYHEARRIPAPEDCQSSWTALAIEHLRHAVDALPPAESQIIRLRYGMEGTAMTLEAIGTLLGLTRERIRQRQAKSELAIRAMLIRALGEPIGATESVVRHHDGLVMPDIAAAESQCRTATTTVCLVVEQPSDPRRDDSQCQALNLASRESQGALFAHAH